MKIEFPDELLAHQWEAIDWDAAEKKLAAWQEELTIAAFANDQKRIVEIQKRIVRDLDIKCLAVDHVVKSTSSPGVDGECWRTAADCMRAAMSLTSKGYHASPLKQILLIAKNTGKERRAGLPTYRDRAMNVLYGYSLIPVAEAHAERKSFAFRKGRSPKDAQAYILESLKGNDAPTIAVVADIKAYYASIHHSWLLAHVPMDKRVLKEFLTAGIVFSGELFPPEEDGISEGSNLSPYLGNFVLDGLQKYIYRGLHHTEHPVDYANGNLIRFADDIFINARSKMDAERIVELLVDFLAERGCTLSAEKTVIASVDEGFTFLGKTYIRKGQYIYVYPAEHKIERFIADITTAIKTNRKSQRDMITLINSKLRGWGNYYRDCDAAEAFKRIDVAVQTALLEAALAKHPRLAKAKIISKYWYKEPSGRHVYALPEDRSVRVIFLADALLIQHNKIKTNANPFIDTDYMESRTHEREIANVSGPYRAIWDRQGGRCLYCGRPILVDQPRTVVPLSLSRPPSVKNSAYIHKICKQNELQVIYTTQDVDAMRPYDIMLALEGVVSARPQGGKRVKKDIPPNWRHIGLKRYLAKCSAASVTLTFKEIEKLDGRPLPKSARVNSDWWYPRQNCNTVAEAWLTEGYSLGRLDLAREKITLSRDESGMTKLVVPKQLTTGKLPINAIYELEQHMDYIIKKYGL